MIFAPYLNSVPTTDVETDLVRNRSGFSDFLDAHAGSTIDPERSGKFALLLRERKA
jgi:hypothetical protein